MLALAYPSSQLLPFSSSHRWRCFLLGILATAAIIRSSVMDEGFAGEVLKEKLYLRSVVVQ